MSRSTRSSTLPLVDRVQSNLLEQNCYVRDVRMSHDLHTEYPSKTYESLDSEVVDSGVREIVRCYPYEITPAYVDSFVASSDYRRDPLGAVVAARPRKNLGDVSAAQEVLSFDVERARSLYDDILGKLSTSASASVVKDSESEVK